jgi:hypothetical protein
LFPLVRGVVPVLGRRVIFFCAELCFLLAIGPLLCLGSCGATAAALWRCDVFVVSD